MDFWLVGAGPMAVAHAQVMKHLGLQVLGIGRGEASAESFRAATGLDVQTGGLEAATARLELPSRGAVIATPVDALADNCLTLIRAGVRRILVEKPAGLDPEQAQTLAQAARDSGAQVFVAYNRRFYASVRKAAELIAEDGGPLSLRLEFSEFSHRIAGLPSAASVKAAWLYANSTHVLDLGFFLAGFPALLSGQVGGTLDWHPAGARFVGHGQTERGALFSWHADWQGAPRWMVEIATARRTLMFQPLEKLKYRDNTGFAETQVDLDTADTDFKPGLLRQMQAFAAGGGVETGLCAIGDHAAHMNGVYRAIRSGGSWASN